MKMESEYVAPIELKAQIPDFWTDDPRLWFAQFEVLLASQKQGEVKKFGLVLPKLSKSTIQQARDIILNPPKKPYTALKERLLMVYEESVTRKLQKVLHESKLGDQKPTQLLRSMKNLAGNKIPDETMRILWMGRLPETVRTVLTVSETTELEKLAKMADRIMEEATPKNTIATVATGTSTSGADLLTAEIVKLGNKIEAINRGTPSTTKPRYRSRSPDKRGEKSSQRKGRLCFYHYRFGKKATKCMQPCSWDNSAAGEDPRRSGN